MIQPTATSTQATLPRQHALPCVLLCLRFLILRPVTFCPAAANSNITVVNKLAAGQLISNLDVWRLPKSSVLGAIKVTYTDGRYEVLGDASLSGDTKASNYAGGLEIKFGQRLRFLAVWTDPVTGAVNGLYMATSGPDDKTLLVQSPLGDDPDAATLSIKSSATDSNFGSGILVALSGLNTPAGLMALDFVFFAPPSSLAVTYDIPTINITNITAQLVAVTKSAVLNSGKTSINSSCPDFTAMVYPMNAFSKSVVGNRLTDLLAGGSILVQQFMRPANLKWTGNATGIANTSAVASYQGSVVDPFTNDKTNDGTAPTVISAPKTTFMVNAGEPQCMLHLCHLSVQAIFSACFVHLTSLCRRLSQYVVAMYFVHARYFFVLWTLHDIMCSNNQSSHVP